MTPISKTHEDRRIRRGRPDAAGRPSMQSLPASRISATKGITSRRKGKAVTPKLRVPCHESEIATEACLGTTDAPTHRQVIRGLRFMARLLVLEPPDPQRR